MSAQKQDEGSQAQVTISDKYLVEKEIGKGSFATVYKGCVVSGQREPGEFVAIKAVSRSKLKNKKLLENLEIEIAILKKIKHPHIVGLMDCERTASDFFLIMEYCALGDLTFLIKKRKGLVEKHPLVRTMFEKYPPPSESHNGLNRTVVVNYLQQLASALKFLRSKNLVHRDIKPQNLLLSTPLIDYHDRDTFHKMGFVGIYNLPILKIADFGFARFLPNTSLAETLCGSPLYMAPEILNYQKYNAKADLWSVGTVLYEMCCGRPPFKASNHLELFKKIKKANDVISFPAHCNLEPEMCDLICGLLTFNPAQRMGFTEFFNHEIVNEDLSRFEEENIPDLEDKSKDVAESNMFISEYLTRPSKKLPISPMTEATSKKQPSKVVQALTSTDAPVHTPLSSKVQHKPLDKKQGNNSAELSIEKEYVMVEKKSVEVNALADEFANYGTTVQGRRSPSFNQQQHQLQQQPQLAALRRNSRNSSSSGGSATRRPSLVERRLSISSLSPSNALTKALGIASTRLFGHQQPASTSSSPSNVTYPLLTQQVFHELTENIVLGASHSIDYTKFNENSSDTVIISLLESLSAKAFVIYSFAEVKFSQVVPLPPSSTDDTQGKRLSEGSCAIEEEEEEEEGDQLYEGPLADHISASLRRRGLSSHSQNTSIMHELPLSDVRRLCTEAIVLYMKALSILAKAMQITSSWWYQSQEKNCSLKLNVLVQWLRDKFNECLEKAEFLRLKLNNRNFKYSDESTIKASSDEDRDRVVEEQNEVNTSEEEEPIFVEKLIYDRALEISKTAAKLEMQGEYLNNCELAYATSLWMLETVLDNGDEEDTYEDQCFGVTGVLDESDKQMIKKYIDSIANRLKILRGKISHS